MFIAPVDRIAARSGGVQCLVATQHPARLEPNQSYNNGCYKHLVPPGQGPSTKNKVQRTNTKVMNTL
ncbi:MAG TPA: hypothetical protein VKB46_00345 [Pyrinomonadaceae bacterium]|nr:hypothetical protein [Pyrinomonadaceae bacterium]